MKLLHHCSGCDTRLGKATLAWFQLGRDGRLSTIRVPVCRDRRMTTRSEPKRSCVARFIANVAEAAGGGAS